VGSSPTARTNFDKHNGGAMPDDQDGFFEKGDETLSEFDQLTQRLSQYLIEFA
jgi:hypothetical protein